MSNAIDNILTDRVGGRTPIEFDLPVGDSTHIYKGTLVTQLTADGTVVPYSTASSGVCVGIAEHEADNSSGSAGDKRVRIGTKSILSLINGAGADAFSEASLIGAVVYGSDDHTVADNSDSLDRQPVGFFYGMQADGKVRVYVDPAGARLYALLSAGFASIADTPMTADALRDDIVAIFAAAFA